MNDGYKRGNNYQSNEDGKKKITAGEKIGSEEAGPSGQKQAFVTFGEWDEVKENEFMTKQVQALMSKLDKSSVINDEDFLIHAL